jgi:hypothetical protein
MSEEKQLDIDALLADEKGVNDPHAVPPVEVAPVIEQSEPKAKDKKNSRQASDMAAPFRAFINRPKGCIGVISNEPLFVLK